MPVKPFFTMEMGIRLRQLRARKGLSQSELAVRMGLRGKGSWSLVSRLERGRIASPSLMLVTHYLNACGALFSEFHDTLTRIEPLPVEAEAREMIAKVPELGSNYGATFQKEVRQKIVTKTADQVHKYQDRTERPLGDEPPMKPERQRKAAEGFKQYRLQLNIIERAVKDMLSRDEDEAFAEHRKPLVRYYEQRGYLILTRKILGVLRRQDQHKPKPQAQANPRRKTLEQRLTEAMRSTAEQQLNLDAAEKVRTLVVETYARLTAGR